MRHARLLFRFLVFSGLFLINSCSFLVYSFLLASDKRTFYMIGKDASSTNLPQVATISVSAGNVGASVSVELGAAQAPATSAAAVTPYFVELGSKIYFRGKTSGVSSSLTVFRCENRNCTTTFTVPTRASATASALADLWGPMKINETHLGWIEKVQLDISTSEFCTSDSKKKS